MKVGERDPLKGLRDTAVSLEDAGVADARGRYISERLAQTIREVPARRRVARRRKAVLWAGAAVSMLGLVLVLGGQLRRIRGASATFAEAAQGVASGPLARDAVNGVVEDLAGQVDVIGANGRTTPAVRASALEPSDEIVTHDGRGSIVLTGGARVDLSEHSRLRLQDTSSAADPLGERLALLEGKVNVHVPHLDRGRSFTVVTPHAEVVVHGTVFTVEVLKPDREPGETCVATSEGLVGVRSVGSEVLLAPGMHWSSRAEGSRCATVRSAPEVPPEAARGSERRLVDDRTATPSLGASGAHRRIKGAGVSGAAPAPAHAPVNPLAAQNRLFEAGMVARQNGDEREAIRLFDELLGKYPDSALASEANEQRRHAQEHLQRGQPNAEP